MGLFGSGNKKDEAKQKVTPSSSLFGSEFEESDNNFVKTKRFEEVQPEIKSEQQKPAPEQPKFKKEEASPAPEQAPVNREFKFKPHIQIIPFDANGEKKLSYIADYASVRSINLATDREHRFVEDDMYVLDIPSTNNDLKELVNKYPEAKYLDLHCCHEITDFTPIANLKNLVELDFADCPNLSDVSFLKDLRKLRVLNLGVTKISDISVLKDLKELEVLDLRFTKIKSISVVRNFTNLRDILLWNTSFLDSLDGIQYCPELRCLDITNCRMITSIEQVRNLKKLRMLLMNYCNVIDMSPIANLVTLQMFSMDNSKHMISEEALRNFENLSDMRCLYINNRMIPTFKYFRNMTKMGELKVAFSSISDVSPLSGMTKMQLLTLDLCQGLRDISPLSTMGELKKLKLNGKLSKGVNHYFMQITDISAVKYMPNLVVFEGSVNNKIKDISPLYFCEVLEEAWFKNCLLLEDITPLRNSTKFVEIHITDCPKLKDIGFLRQNLGRAIFAHFAQTSVSPPSMSLFSRMRMVGVISGPATHPDDEITLRQIRARKDVLNSANKFMQDDPTI